MVFKLCVEIKNTISKMFRLQFSLNVLNKIEIKDAKDIQSELDSVKTEHLNLQYYIDHQIWSYCLLFMIVTQD